MPTRSNERPAVAVQGLCVIALVVLSFIDARFTEFQVDFWVYAIIGGILFGVRDVRDIVGGRK